MMWLPDSGLKSYGCMLVLFYNVCRRENIGEVSALTKLCKRARRERPETKFYMANIVRKNE